jgi:hypothetical protein
MLLCAELMHSFSVQASSRTYRRRKEGSYALLTFGMGQHMHNHPNYGSLIFSHDIYIIIQIMDLFFFTWLPSSAGTWEWQQLSLKTPCIG